MRFIVCWTCGMSTVVKGGGQDEVKAAERIERKHECGKTETEIITEHDR